MKIHMDYLEGKIEQFQAQQAGFEQEKSKLIRQNETLQDKYALYKDQKEREIRELNKKLTDTQNKLKQEREKTTQMQARLNGILVEKAEIDKKRTIEDKDLYTSKLQSINQSIELRSVDSSGLMSNKSKNNTMLQKEQTSKTSVTHYNSSHHQTLSGSKTSTNDAKNGLTQMGWVSNQTITGGKKNQTTQNNQNVYQTISGDPKGNTTGSSNQTQSIKQIARKTSVGQQKIQHMSQYVSETYLKSSNFSSIQSIQGPNSTQGSQSSQSHQGAAVNISAQSQQKAKNQVLSSKLGSLMQLQQQLTQNGSSKNQNGIHQRSDSKGSNQGQGNKKVKSTSQE